MNKRNLLATVTCGVIGIGLFAGVSASAKEVRPTLNLQTGNKSVWSGAKQQIKVKTNARAYGKVAWKTSNKNIAVVDKNGKVTFKKNGRVTITSTTFKKYRNKKLSKSVTYTVKTHVTSVRHTNTPNTMKIGERKTIGASITPNTASDKRFVVTSSNTKVLKVEGKTLVALKYGYANITVKSVEGGKTSVKQVRVLPREEPKKPTPSPTPTPGNNTGKEEVKPPVSPGENGGSGSNGGNSSGTDTKPKEQYKDVTLRVLHGTDVLKTKNVKLKLGSTVKYYAKDFGYDPTYWRVSTTGMIYSFEEGECATITLPNEETEVPVSYDIQLKWIAGKVFKPSKTWVSTFYDEFLRLINKERADLNREPVMRVEGYGAQRHSDELCSQGFSPGKLIMHPTASLLYDYRFVLDAKQGAKQLFDLNITGKINWTINPDEPLSDGWKYAAIIHEQHKFVDIGFTITEDGLTDYLIFLGQDLKEILPTPTYPIR